MRFVIFSFFFMVYGYKCSVARADLREKRVFSKTLEINVLREEERDFVIIYLGEFSRRSAALFCYATCVCVHICVQFYHVEEYSCVYWFAFSRQRENYWMCEIYLFFYVYVYNDWIIRVIKNRSMMMFICLNILFSIIKIEIPTKFKIFANDILSSKNVILK